MAFSTEHSNMGFIAMATYDLRAREEVIFHFVIDYGPGTDPPILVQQQIVSAKEVQTGREGHMEHWAIRVPEGQLSDAVLDHLYRPPFWMRRASDNRMRPSLIVNGARLSDATEQWKSGDFLSITLRVWETHHMLMFLLGSGEEPPDEMRIEHTSFLQIHASAQSISSKLPFTYETPFLEICRTLCQKSPQTDDPIPWFSATESEGRENSRVFEPLHGSEDTQVASSVHAVQDQQQTKMSLPMDLRPDNPANVLHPALGSLRTALDLMFSDDWHGLNHNFTHPTSASVRRDSLHLGSILTGLQ